MAHLNIYKAEKRKNSTVKQTYVLGGLYVTLRNNGAIMISYMPTHKKGKHTQLDLKKDTDVFNFFEGITQLRTN